MVDNWENTMLKTVPETAKTASEQISQLIMGKFEHECDELTKKITSFRADDNCFETDLQQLQTKIDELNEELDDSASLHRIQIRLPTLDCSNMISTKIVEPQPITVPEVKNNDTAVSIKPKKEYHSFMEQFFQANAPTIDLKWKESTGRICASPTMLIVIYRSKISRLVFHRQSESQFEWKHGEVFDIHWSSWLQQFIVRTKFDLVAVDAIEKQSEIVVTVEPFELKCVNHWKGVGVVIDSINRLLLYQMDKNMKGWLLLYCWSKPTTCDWDEDITAIGYNDKNIVLGIKKKLQYSFRVHTHLMKLISSINLAHSCETIQVLPTNEWLISDSSKKYYVIDSELNEHLESNRSPLQGYEVDIQCDCPPTQLVALIFRRKGYNAFVNDRIQVYITN